MFRLLCSFLLGSVAVLGFAPFSWWSIVFFSLAGFLLLILSSFHKNIFLLGLFYGLGYFGFGVGWIQVSVHQFGIPSYFFSYGPEYSRGAIKEENFLGHSYNVEVLDSDSDVR